MPKKLVLAGAVAVVAAGLGQLPAAHAATADAKKGDPVVRVTCVGPIFGAERNASTVTGEIAGVITATGNAVSDIVHGQESLTFYYSCANGPIQNVGNTSIRAANN